MQGKTSNFNIIILFFVVICLFAVSCQDLFFPWVDGREADDGVLTIPPAAIPPGMGVFYLNVDEDVSSRAIVPGLGSISSFVLKFINEPSGISLDLIEILSLDEPVFLPPGSYTLEVSAFSNFPDPAVKNLAAQGTSEVFTIAAGSVSSANVALNAAAISEGGSGSFAWCITVPDGNAFLESNIIVKRYSDEQVMVNLFDQQPVNNGGSFQISGQTALDSGYYIFLIYLKKDAAFAPVSLRQILHVYKNMESFFELELSEESFTELDPLFEGSGTESNPFLITNEYQLRQAGRAGANDNAFAAWTLGAHYKLTANITLSGGNDNWEPIGEDFAGNLFTGTFDGNGFGISAIKMDHGFDAGFFGAVGENGVVKNLNIINADIIGDMFVGALVGTNKGIIFNCTASGNVRGESSVGGLVGWSSGTIQNCYFIGNASGGNFSWLVGGIVGNSEGVVRNCFAAGNVIGGEDVGGITGSNDQGIVQNNIALNEFIAAYYDMQNFVGRVLAYNNSGQLINNYAFANMIVKYNWNGVSGIDEPLEKELNQTDGQDISKAQIKTRAAWETAGFTFNGSPWVWQDGKMPRLYWENKR